MYQTCSSSSVAMNTTSRLFSVSDIHIDFPDNWDWLTDSVNNTKKYLNDGIIVAGDVTHKLDCLEKFFRLLVSNFRDVFYVPGNHDLWVFGQGTDVGSKDSIEKFHQIMELCKRLGVHTSPKKVFIVT